ncbi:MAG: MazG family protein [Chloroflexota bacterium]|nr:MazG family protein [Chloroflexota bacterium]
MPPAITVVGLGPGDPSARTIAAQRALVAAQRILLRTLVHPGIEDLRADPRVSACDDLYETSQTFDEVYSSIVERIIALALAGPLVYAVPGHPSFGERTVDLLRQKAQEAALDFELLPAVSALDVIAATTGIDPFTSELQVLDGVLLRRLAERDPFAGGRLGIYPYRPCLISQVYAPEVASAVKLALTRVYPDDHPVEVLRSAGIPSQEERQHCALFELDRQHVDHLTSVYVPPMAALEAHRSPATLAQIVARLRAPAGCPWDRAQTHASLRDALIEEAYEAVDAIDAGDPGNLAEELGDLVLQAALHAQIAEEAGEFAFEDVLEQVSTKLLRRHPHVFGDEFASTPSDVVKTWNQVKAEERRARGETVPIVDKTERLPRSMPALTRATRVLRAERPVAAPGEPSSTDDFGEQLLNVVARTVASGRDPESELDRALWCHLAKAGHCDGSPSPAASEEMNRS